MGSIYIATYNPQARIKFEEAGTRPLGSQTRFEANSIEHAHAKFRAHAKDTFGIDLDGGDYSIHNPHFGFPTVMGFLQKDPS
jgi:hypothetical protein